MALSGTSTAELRESFLHRIDKVRGEESAAASKIKEVHESKATSATLPLFLAFEAAVVS